MIVIIAVGEILNEAVCFNYLKFLVIDAIELFSLYDLTRARLIKKKNV